MQQSSGYHRPNARGLEGRPLGTGGQDRLMVMASEFLGCPGKSQSQLRLCYGAHLLDLHRRSEMLFIRSIGNHEAMSVSESHIVARILRLLVLGAEVAIHNDRGHVSPSMVATMSFKPLVNAPKNALLRFIRPSFGQVDARAGARRAGDGQSARPGARAVLVTDSVKFTRLQVPPLTGHPQQIAVSVLPCVLNWLAGRLVYQRTGTE